MWDKINLYKYEKKKQKRLTHSNFIFYKSYLHESYYSIIILHQTQGLKLPNQSS